MKVLFAMPSEKSPGPDGYTAEFYKSAWSIIGSEFFIAFGPSSKKDTYQKGLIQQFWHSFQRSPGRR